MRIYVNPKSLKQEIHTSMSHLKVMVDAVNLADNELGKFFRDEYSNY